MNPTVTLVINLTHVSDGTGDYIIADLDGAHAQTMRSASAAIQRIGIPPSIAALLAEGTTVVLQPRRNGK